MNDSTDKNLMSVSVRARQAGLTETISLVHTEGYVSMARAEDGTVLIKIKPLKPTRTRRRRRTRPSPLQFQSLALPAYFWLEMSCLSLPQAFIQKRE